MISRVRPTLPADADLLTSLLLTNPRQTSPRLLEMFSG